MQTAYAVLQSTPSSHSHAAEFNRYWKPLWINNIFATWFQVLQYVERQVHGLSAPLLLDGRQAGLAGQEQLHTIPGKGGHIESVK